MSWIKQRRVYPKRHIHTKDNLVYTSNIGSLVTSLLSAILYPVWSGLAFPVRATKGLESIQSLSPGVMGLWRLIFGTFQMSALIWFLLPHHQRLHDPVPTSIKVTSGYLGRNTACPPIGPLAPWGPITGRLCTGVQVKHHIDLSLGNILQRQIYII